MQKGFTLIELMIVLAIVGILASIIYPMVFGGSSGNRPLGARDFGGTVVNETKCSNGLVTKNGDVVVKDGAGVKC